MAICEKGRSRDFSRELWVNFCLNKILFKNPQGTKNYIFSENFIYSIFKIIFFASFNVSEKESYDIQDHVTAATWRAFLDVSQFFPVSAWLYPLKSRFCCGLLLGSFSKKFQI